MSSCSTAETLASPLSTFQECLDSKTTKNTYPNGLQASQGVPNGSLILIFKYHSVRYCKNTWVDFQSAITPLEVPQLEVMTPAGVMGSQKHCPSHHAEQKECSG